MLAELLTSERTDGRVVDEGEDEDESANSPRHGGFVGGSKAHKADDEQRDEDPDHAREIDCSASEPVDQRPRDDCPDESDGVLAVSDVAQWARTRPTNPRVMLNA